MGASVSADGWTLTCLQDGETTFDAAVFPDVPPRAPEDYATHFNAFLLRGHGAAVLVDCGAGRLFGAIAGRLPQVLAAKGLAADDITHLVFTHLHTDHCGGALDDTGAPVFRNAQVILHAAELAQWRDSDHFAARVIAASADRLQAVEDGAALLPGVTAWHLPGHTQGHMGLRIGETLAVVGDIVHAERLQLADPDLSPHYDSDPDQARITRRAALDAAAARDLTIAGGHLLGGLARVTCDGRGFRRVPA